MSALNVARQNIQEFGDELWGKAQRVAISRGHKFPAPADVLQQFARECVGLLSEFSDRCSNKFSWVDERGLPNDEWHNGEQWGQYSETQMGFLLNRLNDFIEPLSRTAGVTVNRELQIQQATKLLTEGHVEVLRKLKLELAQKVEESRGRSKAQEAERAQKAGERKQDRGDKWLIAIGSLFLGAIITQGGNYYFAWKKGDLDSKTSNCQNSSTSASSTPTATSQTSGPAVPSTPQSVGLPHASHPAPATPSSTRRP